MKNQTLSYIISFTGLHEVFQQTSEQEFAVARTYGAEMYPIEDGLTAHLWDVRFWKDAEIFSTPEVSDSKYTVAFFPDARELRLWHDGCWLKKNPSWNMMFAKTSNLRIYLSAAIRYRCLLINFTKAWICESVARTTDHLLCNEGPADFNNETELQNSMNAHEMKTVLEIFENSCRRLLGGLYIKSLVLKLISDYFIRTTVDKHLVH